MTAEATPPPEFYHLCAELVRVRYRCRVVRTQRDEVLYSRSTTLGASDAPRSRTRRASSGASTTWSGSPGGRRRTRRVNAEPLTTKPRTYDYAS